MNDSNRKGKELEQAVAMIESILLSNKVGSGQDTLLIKSN